MLSKNNIKDLAKEIFYFLGYQIAICHNESKGLRTLVARLAVTTATSFLLRGYGVYKVSVVRAKVNEVFFCQMEMQFHPFFVSLS